MPLIDVKLCVAITLPIKGLNLCRYGYKLDQYTIYH